MVCMWLWANHSFSSQFSSSVRWDKGTSSRKKRNGGVKSLTWSPAVASFQTLWCFWFSSLFWIPNTRLYGYAMIDLVEHRWAVCHHVLSSVCFVTNTLAIEVGEMSSENRQILRDRTTAHSTCPLQGLSAQFPYSLKKSHTSILQREFLNYHTLSEYVKYFYYWKFSATILAQ